MNENDFNDSADAQLDAIVAAFDASGLDCEPERKAGGVLEIEFENGSRMIARDLGGGEIRWFSLSPRR